MEYIYTPCYLLSGYYLNLNNSLSEIEYRLNDDVSKIKVYRY